MYNYIAKAITVDVFVISVLLESTFYTCRRFVYRVGRGCELKVVVQSTFVLWRFGFKIPSKPKCVMHTAQYAQHVVQ